MVVVGGVVGWVLVVGIGFSDFFVDLVVVVVLFGVVEGA